MSNRDPLNQLSEFHLEVDDDARRRDLEAIGAELRTRLPRAEPVRRRWTIGVVVAVMLAGPAAAAASDSAVPGDLLYPVKLALEPIVELFDRDVVVERRVQEVAVLVDRRSEDQIIRDRIAVARDALAETDEPQLEQELDLIVDRWITDRQPGSPDVADAPADTTVPLRDERREEPSDREPEPVEPPVSTTTVTDRPGATDRPAEEPGTTTAPSGDETRPSDDRPRDTP